MTYSAEAELLMAECKEQGFNMWPLLAIFKKRSKLDPKIPDEVIMGVCKAYLGNKRPLRADFPYFLKVLETESRKYFATRQIEDHARIKKEPMAIKNIFKLLAQQ